MEFNREIAPKPKRQSKIYDADDWIRDDRLKGTAGNFFGHSMAVIDNTTVYRVLLQNPNGIDPSPTNQHFQSSLNTCYDHCTAFISLTETNIEWSTYANREKLRLSLKKWWDGSSFQTSIVCGSHWVARIIEKGADASGLGRWTYIGLQGTKSTKILHITWYLVCQTGKIPGYGPKSSPSIGAGHATLYNKETGGGVFHYFIDGRK